MADTANIAVIGAGIAGLSAGYQLHKAGFKTTLLEQNDYAGGRIKSIRREGYTFDVGAFIYLGSYDDSIELIKELGLEGQLGKFDAYGAMPKGGQLKYLDFNKPISAILGTDYLSFGSKLKLIKLMAFLFKHWKDLNYYDASGVAAIDNDTVQSYCVREMNDEIYEYVAGVVVRGPWLSNPETTSVGQMLWTMKNFFKPYFYGLDNGMAALPEAIAKRLDVRLNSTVSNVADHGTYVDVTWAADGRETTQRFDGCIITTPAQPALAMFPQMHPVQQEFYRNTTYISALDAHLVLRKKPNNPATYIMVSSRENLDLCGVIVDHLKARNRVPEGMGMMTVFSRDEWCKKNMDQPDELVLNQIYANLKPYYGDLSGEVVDYELGRWPIVVPKMPQGRFKQIVAYEKSIDPMARVQLAGDLDPIAGVNAALVSGKKAAQRIAGQYA